MALPDPRQIVQQINIGIGLPDPRDIVNRINQDPRNIVAQLNKSIVDTDETFLSFLEPLQYGEFLTAGITQSILKGIPISETINQKHTFSDIVNEQFPELSRGERIALGFALSIAFDPLTYVGIGTLTKAGRAAKIAKQLAATPAQQAAIGQRALIKFAGRTIPGFRGEKVFKSFEKGGKALRAAPITGKIIEKTEELFAPQRRLKKLFPEFLPAKLKFSAKTQDEIAVALERSDAIKALVPDPVRRAELATLRELSPEEALILGRRVANDKEVRALQLIDAISNENERRLIEVGLLTDEWITGFKKKFGLQRLAHIRTPIGLIASIRKLGAIRGRGIVKQAKVPGLEHSREIAGTIEEINRQFGKVFFETDVAKILRVDGVNIAEAINAEDFLRHISTNPAWVKGAAKTPAGKFVAEEGFSLVNHPAFLGKQVPKEIAADIRGMTERLQGLNVQGDFLNVYDSIQNTWKAWTLGIFPAYHSRNVVGNLWLNFLFDVNPIFYNDAIRMQITQTPLKGGRMVSRVMGLKPGSITTKAGKIIDDKEVMRQAKRLQVVGRGIYGVDIPIGSVEKIRRGNSIILGEETKLLRAGFGIGKTLEDNARLTHFIDRIVKGFSYEDAAISTKKALFDYSELSRFERNVMKRIFPFYTWSRKNVPIEIEKLIQQPGKFAGIPKIKEAIEESQGGKPNSVFMSDFLKDNFAIRTRKVGAQEQFFLLKNWLPATDILEILAPIDLAGEMLTPILKAPVQWAANYNLFFKSQVEKTPGELGEFLSISMRKKTIDLLRNIRILNTIDRLNPGNVFGTDRTFRLDLPQKERWVSFFTGLKLYANDEEKAIMWFNIRLRMAIRERQASLRKSQRRGFDPEVQRLLEEIQNMKREGAAALATQRR